MKKLIATLSTLLIVASLFAADPQFSLNAQVEGILFHGFTTKTYTTSDQILAGQSEIEQDATIKGLELSSNAVQPVGSYILYATNTIQSSVTFETTPLELTVLDDTYYVPYELTYTSDINNKITLLTQTVGEASQATTSGDNLIQKANVFTTSEDSTGLRYGILDLSVQFAGDENVSFGLPEASGENFYTGTITAMINVN